MSQYLSPSKIGLLVLIKIYLEGAVPSNAVVPVINLLATHILDCNLTSPSPTPGEQWKKAENTIKLTLSVQHFEDLLTPFAAVDRLPGRSLWDRFLERLWGLDSLHSLNEFFTQLPSILARTKDELRDLAARGKKPPSGVLLGRTSPFGVFARKVHVESAKLQFHHLAELWKLFVRYRQPTAGYWRRRNPQHTRLSFDAVLQDGEHEWGTQTDEIAVAAYGNMLLHGQHDALNSVSTDDIENLLEFQIEQAQKYGARVPPTIRDQFEKLLKSSIVIPSLSHYINFAEAWRSGEFPAAFDHLHRYFDYTMQNRDRLFYQYALLNLAIVQSDFGCHKEAVATMLEAISTAKENRDTACLNFALNWFYHFGKAHPKLVKELDDGSMLGSGKELLAFLRAKAKETGMWILWSSSLLSEAKLGLSNGESVSIAVENIVRSSQIIVEKNVKSMLGPQTTMGIALWSRLGMAVMSHMICEIFLRCHVHTSLSDDKLKLSCQMAEMLAARGLYKEAYGKIEGLEANSPRSAKSNLHRNICRGVLKLRQDIHRNNLESAEALLSQLLQTAAEDTEADMVFTIDMLHIDTLIRRKYFDAAFTKIERLMSELREDNRDSALRIRLLLAKVHLFDATGRPEKGFTIAMRAVSLAWRSRLVCVLWEAVGALANILNALGEFGPAERLLVAAIPRCLETNVVFTAGVLYSLLADARVGLVGEIAGHPGTGEWQRRMGLAHAALDKAYDSFSAVEDLNKKCEMMAKKAALFKAGGELGKAEECASTYLRLRDEGKAWGKR
ncbi:anaphase-promoting complex subunit 5-domain-containing protein [Chaetomium sp. MPI-SDFR-AT-0129]|nr:anaphase-promoting complex subunit 5-domain-containing protein [Chaetomium sp. MPI-SDFR-AT-0129]